MSPRAATPRLSDTIQAALLRSSRVVLTDLLAQVSDLPPARTSWMPSDPLGCQEGEANLQAVDLGEVDAPQRAGVGDAQL